MSIANKKRSTTVGFYINIFTFFFAFRMMTNQSIYLEKQPRPRFPDEREAQPQSCLNGISKNGQRKMKNSGCH